MAISYVDQDGNDIVEYEGCVLGVFDERTKTFRPTSSRSIRIMFSVWSTETYTVVWESKMACERIVTLNVAEYDAPSKTVKIDATPEIIAEWQWKKKADAVRQREFDGRAAVKAYRLGGDASAAEFMDQLREEVRIKGEEVYEEESKKWAHEPRKGERARVVKGHKVPLGTEGVFFWEREGKWGVRIGIIDDHGDKHWTYLKNIEGVPDKPEDMTWADYRRQKQQEAAQAALEAQNDPRKGDLVLVLDGDRAGEAGTVFWSSAGRLGVGFGEDSGGLWEDKAWLNTEQVEKAPTI